MQYEGPPDAQGLYDPANEHDACGVGFVAHVKGRRSHAIVRQALQVLINLQHRGACGCETNTGDGAGILIQMPDRFFRQAAEGLEIDLPRPGGYGAGLIFLPREPDCRRRIKALFERVVVEEGQRVLGWREVPTDNRALGASAVSVQPVFQQILIGRGPALPPPGASPDGDARFERKLYVIRKRVEHAVDALSSEDRRFFYVVSLSSQTLIYKGMLTAGQLETMFPDLADRAMDSALALV
ncbi:MAG: glutamate synthase subunit alpha, partial [Acidobacteria bacterium]|nr:glutamate synthase subunit alpha [Acidobacteriota bacterium]